MITNEKTYVNGEVIIKEGDIGNSFFQLLEGNAGVYLNYGKEDQVKLGVLSAGQYFGEMAVIESYPRSSSVIAEGDARAIEIPEKELNNYFSENPDKIIAIMKHLGNRIKALTDDYTEAKGLLADLKNEGIDKKNESVLSKLKKHMNWVMSGKNNISKPSAESLRETSDKVSASENGETYKKGTIIFKQGEVGKCMYIVHGGSVGIYSNYGQESEIRLTELYPTSCFGEMGMIAEEARSATAVAESDETFVEIIRLEDLETLFKSSPITIEMILRHLSYRLRKLTYDYYSTCKEISDAYSK